jgi:hypothetical protein
MNLKAKRICIRQEEKTGERNWDETDMNIWQKSVFSCDHIGIVSLFACFIWGTGV